MTTGLDFRADTEGKRDFSHSSVFSHEESAGRNSATGPVPIWFLVSAICGLGLLLRLHALGTTSLWIDEGISAMIVRLPWSGFLKLIQRREGNGALYYLILRGWTHLGGSEFVIRAMSVLAGVLAVGAIYFLGKELFSKNAGILAALLLAVHAFHIRYSQQARTYSLVILLLLFSAYFLVRAVESDKDWHWLLFVVFSALAVYAHFFAALAIMAEICSLGFLPTLAILRRRLLGTLALLGGLVFPAVWYAYTHAKISVTDWIPPITWHIVYSCALALTGSGGALLLLAYLFACTLAFLPSTGALSRLISRGRHFPLALTVLWALFPAFLLSAVSLIKPLLFDRYMSMFIPGFVLLAASGLARLRGRLRLPATAILVLLSLAGVRTYFKEGPPENEDWRGAVAYASQHAAAGDVAILNNGFARPVFEYYRQMVGSAPRVFSGVPRSDELTYLDFEGIPNQHAVNRLADSHDRVWMFDWNRDSALSRMLDQRFHREDVPNFTGINVGLYVRRDSYAAP